MFRRALRRTDGLYFDDVKISPGAELIAEYDQYPRYTGKALSFFDGGSDIVLFFYTITEVSCKSVGKKGRVSHHADGIGLAEA